MITYNEFGEVVAVNGIITGHNIGTPMQDAKPEKPEDNECYAEERCTITNACNTVLDAQPKPSGGGAEIKTCTVRFIPHSFSDGWESFENAKSYGIYGYTKCVDGVISTDFVRTNEYTTDFDVTLENVVCGSFMLFSSNAERVTIEGENCATWDNIDADYFIAPTEANAVCTIKLSVMGEGGW